MTAAPPVTAFIALGANLDDPQQQLRDAIGRLAELAESRLVRSSSLYRTAPVGVGPQPAYVNAVAELETRLAADALLAQLLAFEQEAGRVRLKQGAPRTLDLDLLLYGDQTLHQPGLIVPHPRLHLRAFALVPLLEIAPDATIPGRGSAAAWYPVVHRQAIERIIEKHH